MTVRKENGKARRIMMICASFLDCLIPPEGGLEKVMLQILTMGEKHGKTDQAAVGQRR